VGGIEGVVVSVLYPVAVFGAAVNRPPALLCWVRRTPNARDGSGGQVTSTAGSRLRLPHRLWRLRYSHCQGFWRRSAP
jgi:hypothetical protein